MEFKLTKSDIRLSIIFFVLATIIGCADYQEYDDINLLWIDSLNYLLVTSFTAYVLIYVIFARFFPTKQFGLLFLFGISFLFLMGIFETQWHCFFRKCRGNLFTLTNMYYGMMAVIESVGIFGVFLLGKKLYDAQVRFLEIEKEKKESELRFLKSQIDPHFLFNNLNTIDSLIDSNPKVAKTYLHKLSQLYRYLISSKDFEVVPLEEEIEFAQNYMYLIESRYGDAYQFEINTELDNINDYLIPPGALQTLLENIVKHNHGSSTNPITTNINITKSQITISNNKKTKMTSVDSTGIGLTNLKARYQLLTDQVVEINSDKDFIVKLPMIKQVA